MLKFVHNESEHAFEPESTISHTYTHTHAHTRFAWFSAAGHDYLQREVVVGGWHEPACEWVWVCVCECVWVCVCVCMCECVWACVCEFDRYYLHGVISYSPLCVSNAFFLYYCLYCRPLRYKPQNRVVGPATSRQTEQRDLHVKQLSRAGRVPHLTMAPLWPT